MLTSATLLPSIPGFGDFSTGDNSEVRSHLADDKNLSGLPQTLCPKSVHGPFVISYS